MNTSKLKTEIAKLKETVGKISEIVGEPESGNCIEYDLCCGINGIIDEISYMEDKLAD